MILFTFSILSFYFSFYVIRLTWASFTYFLILLFCLLRLSFFPVGFVFIFNLSIMFSPCPLFGLCRRFPIFLTFVCPAFFVLFKFFNVTSSTLCYLFVLILISADPAFSFVNLQPCFFIPAFGRNRFSWLAILVRIVTLSYVFICIPYFLFGLFIHVHIYRSVPAPSILLGPVYFACLIQNKFITHSSFLRSYNNILKLSRVHNPPPLSH